MNMNIGLPEILFVLVIVGLLWMARRVRVRGGFVKYALIVLTAVAAGILVYNYTTTFRAIPLWQE